MEKTEIVVLCEGLGNTRNGMSFILCIECNVYLCISSHFRADFESLNSFNILWFAKTEWIFGREDRATC